MPASRGILRAMLQRLELCYVWYAWTVAILIAWAGEFLPGRSWWFLGHVAVVFPALLLSRSERLGLRLAAACVLTPTAFATLGSILPELVPEAVHWDVYEWDLAVGGAGVRGLLTGAPAWLVELAQICYALFYFLPILLGLALLWQGRDDDALRVAELSVGALLLSYLGYLAFPTLPPYRFVDYGAELSGGPSFEMLHALLYEFEPLREDCMPSGHTMLTLLVGYAAWRLDPKQLRWIVPIGVPLLLATVLLRYHWWVDILAGALTAGLALALFWRADRGRAVEAR